MLDWKKIEKSLGHKIAYAAVCGSRLSNLQTKNSDYDYVVYVWPSKKLENPGGATKINDLIDGDIFVRDLNTHKKIGISGAFWPAVVYHGVVYADDVLKEFLNQNVKRLSNMNIERFYKSGLMLIEGFCTTNQPKRLAIGLREAGIIHNFMKIGDVAESCFLDGEFLEMYHKLKRNDPSISGYDVHKKISFLYDEST